MNKRRTAVVLGLGVVAAFALSGCSAMQETVTWQDDGVPRHENSHQDWWNYEFVFHPHANVYYQPYTTMYFWCEDGVWRTGEKLPLVFAFNLDHRTAQVVKLSHDLPFLQHDSTVWRVRAPHGAEMPENFVPVGAVVRRCGVQVCAGGCLRAVSLRAHVRKGQPMDGRIRMR